MLHLMLLFCFCFLHFFNFMYTMMLFNVCVNDTVQGLYISNSLLMEDCL